MKLFLIIFVLFKSSLVYSNVTISDKGEITLLIEMEKYNEAFCLIKIKGLTASDVEDIFLNYLSKDTFKDKDSSMFFYSLIDLDYFSSSLINNENFYENDYVLNNLVNVFKFHKETFILNSHYNWKFKLAFISYIVKNKNEVLFDLALYFDLYIETFPSELKEMVGYTGVHFIFELLDQVSTYCALDIYVSLHNLGIFENYSFESERRFVPKILKYITTYNLQRMDKNKSFLPASLIKEYINEWWGKNDINEIGKIYQILKFQSICFDELKINSKISESLLYLNFIYSKEDMINYVKEKNISSRYSLDKGECSCCHDLIKEGNLRINPSFMEDVEDVEDVEDEIWYCENCNKEKLILILDNLKNNEHIKRVLAYIFASYENIDDAFNQVMQLKKKLFEDGCNEFAFGQKCPTQGCDNSFYGSSQYKRYIKCQSCRKISFYSWKKGRK